MQAEWWDEYYLQLKLKNPTGKWSDKEETVWLTHEHGEIVRQPFGTYSLAAEQELLEQVPDWLFEDNYLYDAHIKLRGKYYCSQCLIAKLWESCHRNRDIGQVRVEYWVGRQFAENIECIYDRLQFCFVCDICLTIAVSDWYKDEIKDLLPFWHLKHKESLDLNFCVPTYRIES
jgi:hypothetical protein